METKKCTKCGEVKPVEMFYKCTANRDGLTYHCKACIADAQREYRKRPEVRAQRREYKKRPEVRAQRCEYNSRPEVRAQRADYDAEYRCRPSSKERERARHKKYREKQKSIMSDAHIRYVLRVKNPPTALVELKRCQIHVRILTDSLLEALREYQRD